jgi:tRNA (guanine37-N1)-methyltransferase
VLRVAVVTIFPEMFGALTGFGISGRAVREGLVELKCWNPRDYASDRHVRSMTGPTAAVRAW